MATPELEPTPFDEYTHSAQQLLGLLDTGIQQRYYRAAWDELEAAKINDVVLMTAEPTGARKQRRWGQFHSAQFLFTEVTGADEPVQRHVWCGTAQDRAGAPIEPNTLALTRNHGYREINSGNIMLELIEHATSADNYITLTALMKQQGMMPANRLVTNVNRLIRLCVSGQPDMANRPSAVPGPDKIFELIASLRRLSPDAARASESQLVGPLMRQIGQQEPTADRAASVLEAALRHNVIPDNSPLIHRIFANRRVYTYPFATEMVHAKLQAQPSYETDKRIFGEERAVFASDYIASIVETADASLTPHIANLWRNAQAKGEGPADHHQDLYLLLNGLIALVKAPVDVRPPIDKLTEVGPAFAYVLSQLARSKPEITAWLAKLDGKCIAVVEQVLTPIIRRRVGGQVLSADQSEGSAGLNGSPSSLSLRGRPLRGRAGRPRT